MATHDILMWRCFLTAAWLDPKRFCRPFLSFITQEPTLVISFDASLQGLGIVIEDIRGVMLPRFIQVYPLPFDLMNDSSYQNTVEFLAILAAVCHLVRKDRRNGVAISLRGDSVTALSWAGDMSFRGSSVRKAAMVFAYITSKFNVNVVSVHHIAGVDNDIPDAISRNLDTSKKGVMWKTIPTNSNLEGLDHLSLKLINLCSPLSPLESTEDYASFWRSVVEVVEVMQG
jgi:hypothetical protein